MKKNKTKIKAKKTVKQPIPVVEPSPITVTVISAGIVDGKFQVKLSNGMFLGKVEEVATKKVGYGNNFYVNIFCALDFPKDPTTELSTPISQQMTVKAESTIKKGKQS